MYTTEDILKGINDPRLIWQEGKKLIEYPTNRARRRLFYLKYGSPCEVTNEDWDFLIILDACRYDILDDLDWFDEEVERRLSKASHSREFAIKNFAGQTHYDTVYVTANGHVADIAQNNFHNFIFTDVDDFSDSYETIHPSKQGLAPNTVYEAALDTYDEYPNKQIIIHFMQPHAPYFGDGADQLEKKLCRTGFSIKTRNPEEMESMGLEEDEITVVKAARKGLISQKELRNAYISNLKKVLHYVDLLLDRFDGKFAITADHGELLGEGGKFARHPKETYKEELRYVPWVEVTSGPRREIIDEEPSNSKKIADEKIEDRLSALGYRN